MPGTVSPSSTSLSPGNAGQAATSRILSRLMSRHLSPFDLLPHGDLREKLVELVLRGGPPGLDAETGAQFQHLRLALEGQEVADVRVVVFGGGTGLSNLVGGDSRSVSWPRKPFVGLKEVFPLTRAIVCVTDDGGSTGELQKDLPLIALGDLRHVLLSSIQSARLQSLYGLNQSQAMELVSALAALFNYRFTQRPDSAKTLAGLSGIDLDGLPVAMREALTRLLERLFTDPRLSPALSRPHCLGNLLVASAIYAEIPPLVGNDELIANHALLTAPLHRGLNGLAAILGAAEQAVLPCTSTPALLRMLYSNGVQVTGEYKSGYAQRGYPVERVFVEFCEEPHVSPEVLAAIAGADILVMAPGSLYSSLIPVFQVPGLAQAVRDNSRALKILVSNLWVQAGETDRSMGDGERKFHVSDLLRAYERNIPGGTRGLFDQVLCLSLKDVPASVLQSYAVEGKVPIFLDRDKVCAQGFTPIECGIFSRTALHDHGFIQHGPIHLTKVIKTLWAMRTVLGHELAAGQALKSELRQQPREPKHICQNNVVYPVQRYGQIGQRLVNFSIDMSGCPVTPGLSAKIRQWIQDILWRHPDIPLAHLDTVRGLVCVEQDLWRRSQKWDSVFSFYDPQDGLIKIRQDQVEREKGFEVAFLVALGQSLLGNYARAKEMQTLAINGLVLGKVYHLHLRSAQKRTCWFTEQELRHYLELARMLPQGVEPLEALPGGIDSMAEQSMPAAGLAGETTHFTRLINGDEGFTPPGMLMGLNYAWYLDNRFASHVEYKMAVMKIAESDLIPEQVKMLGRRQRLVSFFREVVFRKKCL
jgi:uncharacterized cofD-like protein